MSKRPPPATLPGLESFGLSPLRRQYLELKRAHPDALLLFRLGDFYEMFDDDAQEAATLLNIVLTAREMGRGERVPMAGIPYHASEGYISRLIAAGRRVAVCEQVTEPNGRDLVERRVVRVVTPGTVEDSFLSSSANNYLASVVLEQRAGAIAYVDVTTGEIAATELDGPEFEAQLAAELGRLSPSECVVPDGTADVPVEGALMTFRPQFAFGGPRAAQRLSQRFGAASLHGLGLAESRLAVRALGGLIEYLEETYPAALAAISAPQIYSAAGHLLLDSAARRALEISGQRHSSGPTLLQTIDETRTPMGARTLSRWLSQPLADLDALQARQEAVAAMVDDHWLRGRIRSALQSLGDLERMANRLGQRLSSPRDLLSLARTLRQVPGILAAVDSGIPAVMAVTGAMPDPQTFLADQIELTLVDEPPHTIGEGVIRDGISPDLDEQRALSGDARDWLAALEKRERERSGVRGLKVGYNRVFGYYFEVSASVLAQTTDYYQKDASGAATLSEHLSALGYTRKQTLATAERFVTEELKDLERRVQQSRERAVALEAALFGDLLDRLARDSQAIVASARFLGVLDVLAALAEVAVARGYVRPNLDNSLDLVVESGRHPVLERAMPTGAFVPNDISLVENGQHVMLLTGPNMAGKSTLGKAVLSIVILAQTGSYVPATSARIGLVDRIFVRAGAGEDLAGGRSTFMVEMEETAGFLHHATRRSLAFLDEVGRGTSTFDGMALARAILEHVVEPPGPQCRLIFSTHYHELGSLASSHPGIGNYRMDVREDGERAVFLYRAVPGAADRSYGVHVARLAGIPASVTRRAASLLEELEESATPPRVAPVRERAREDHPALQALRRLRPDQLTPLEALVVLDRLHRQAAKTPESESGGAELSGPDSQGASA